MQVLRVRAKYDLSYLQTFMGAQLSIYVNCFILQFFSRIKQQEIVQHIQPSLNNYKFSLEKDEQFIFENYCFVYHYFILFPEVWHFLRKCISPKLCFDLKEKWFFAKTRCHTPFPPKLDRCIQMLETLSLMGVDLFVSILPFDNGIIFHHLFLFEIPGFTDH